jgi:hypothetical protein
MIARIIRRQTINSLKLTVKARAINNLISQKKQIHGLVFPFVSFNIK